MTTSFRAKRRGCILAKSAPAVPVAGQAILRTSRRDRRAAGVNPTARHSTRRVGRVRRGPPAPRGGAVGLAELGPPYHELRPALSAACLTVSRQLPSAGGSPSRLAQQRPTADQTEHGG